MRKEKRQSTSVIHTDRNRRRESTDCMRCAFFISCTQKVFNNTDSAISFPNHLPPFPLSPNRLILAGINLIRWNRSRWEIAPTNHCWFYCRCSVKSTAVGRTKTDRSYYGSLWGLRSADHLIGNSSLSPFFSCFFQNNKKLPAESIHRSLKYSKSWRTFCSCSCYDKMSAPNCSRSCIYQKTSALFMICWIFTRMTELIGKTRKVPIVSNLPPQSFISFHTI